MKRIILVCFLILFSRLAFSSFMPENDLHLQDKRFKTAIEYEDYNFILDLIKDTYKPIVSNFDANLIIENEWDSPTVNAYAYKQGRNWFVVLHGGLARREELNADSVAMVICHELGHHLGGYPFYPWSNMSNEGQSDYFSTGACFKKYLEQTIFLGKIEEEAIEYCDEKQDPSINCTRTITAGMGLAKLLNRGYVSPFETSDYITDKMINKHPDAICRFDTYKAGYFCHKKWNDKIIPLNKYDSFKVSCQKPRCWFK